MKKTAVLLYLDFTALDGIGPLGGLGRIPEGKIHYVSLSGGPVVNQAGLTVMTELLDLNSFGGAASWEILHPRRRSGGYRQDDGFCGGLFWLGDSPYHC